MAEQEMVPKVVVDTLLHQIAMLQDTVKSLQATVEGLRAIIADKNQTIQNQNRARFGQSSEKTVYVLGGEQISLFPVTGDGVALNPQPGETDAQPSPVAGPGDIAVSAHTRKRKPKRTLEELAEGLPVEEIVVDLPEEQKFNAEGQPLKFIGQQTLRKEIIREPQKIHLRVYIGKSYADPKAEERTGYADIRQAAAPAPVVPHSYASASLVTDMLVKKFLDGLPLYRQEQMWKRLGVPLMRNTMANWVIWTSSHYFKPIWDLLKEVLLKGNVIHADETVLQVLKEPGKPAKEKSRIWAYATCRRAEVQIRIFQYEPSRKGACAEEFLSGFHGVLLADGYSGYNVVSDVVRAGCWAHQRRKWRDAIPKELQGKRCAGAIGYEYCNRLFDLEQKLESLPDEERKRQRQLLAKPILDEYYTWVDSLFKPSGNLKQAVTYAQNQRPYLSVFLDHGEIEISNNQVENAIRPIVIGRKNWLFSDTPEGAEASCLTYSLLETAKVNGLNPAAWLMHILTVLPDRFAADSKASVDDLLPWKEDMRNRFALER